MVCVQQLGEDRCHLLQNHLVTRGWGSKMVAGMDKEKGKGWRLGFEAEKEDVIQSPLSLLL